jgi:hypothetical protein
MPLWCNIHLQDMITPLIAAIFAGSNFAELSFTINGSKFKYGKLVSDSERPAAAGDADTYKSKVPGSSGSERHDSKCVYAAATSPQCRARHAKCLLLLPSCAGDLINAFLTFVFVVAALYFCVVVPL